MQNNIAKGQGGAHDRDEAKGRVARAMRARAHRNTARSSAALAAWRRLVRAAWGLSSRLVWGKKTAVLWRLYRGQQRVRLRAKQAVIGWDLVRVSEKLSVFFTSSRRG